MRLLPSTKLGKYSALCMGGFVVLFLIGTVVVVGIFQQQGGDTFADNLYISLPMLGALIMALLALVFGLVSIVKDQDKSLAVYAIVVVGLLISIFVIGEVIVPH